MDISRAVDTTMRHFNFAPTEDLNTARERVRENMTLFLSHNPHLTFWNGGQRFTMWDCFRKGGNWARDSYSTDIDGYPTIDHKRWWKLSTGGYVLTSHAYIDFPCGQDSGFDRSVIPDDFEVIIVDPKFDLYYPDACVMLVIGQPAQINTLRFPSGVL